LQQQRTQWDHRRSSAYEVRDAAWRAQFIGKSTRSMVQRNVDFKNRSGATLPSKPLTEGVERVLTMYETSLKDAP
jgi:hypothetical protein